MQEFQFLFEQSPWFILLCLLAGIAYAWLLYKPAAKQSWSRSINYTLFGLRFLVVSLLALLLLGPYVKQLKRTYEEPTVVIAVDNSLSLAEVYDSAKLENIRQTVKDLQQSLGEEAEVQVRSLSAALPADSLRFQEKSTDLSQLLAEVGQEYENRNLAGLVLLSDGIYNRGLSPVYSPAGFPVFTLGLGDTIPKKDLNLKALYYNKIAYQGNQFRLLAELEQNGFGGEAAIVRISHKGRTLAEEEIQLREDQPLYETEFILEAETEGLQHYVVSVTPKDSEFTHSNNRKHAYIEVVEGQEKILIAAPAPHPDIKAIRSAIEKNQNYEVSFYIPGISEFKPDKYDLVILHQLPSRQSVPQLQEVLNSSKAHWYIIGRQTNIPAFNELNPLLRINQGAQEFDEAFPVYNPAFSLFTYPAEFVAQLNEYPPVLVPFGQFELKEEASALLYQRVGNITTDRPLLVMQAQDEQKTAVLLGEGIWQWRLQEWAQAEQFTAFDELIQKTVQLLSAKEDRRPFKVYPVDREVFDTEGVTFETEVYNQLYERIWGQEIKLTLTNETGEQKTYQYINSRNNPRYTISNLPQGVYTYQATTNRQGEQLTTSGEFTVNELQLESLELTADFNLLRQLAEESGGTFYPYSEAEALEQELLAKEFKSTVYAVEDFLPIIHLKWLFFLILLLISAEWFIRKYSGSY